MLTFDEWWIQKSGFAWLGGEPLDDPKAKIAHAAWEAGRKAGLSEAFEKMADEFEEEANRVTSEMLALAKGLRALAKETP